MKSTTINVNDEYLRHLHLQAFRTISAKKGAGQSRLLWRRTRLVVIKKAGFKKDIHLVPEL